MKWKLLQLVAGLCLILSVGVIVNVLFLQERGVSYRAMQADWLNGGNRQLDTRGETFSADNTKRREGSGQKIKVPPSQQLVRAVQRELKERKYYGGQLDGSLTIHTQAAIMDYEAEHSRSLTAEVSDALLRTILLGASLDVGPVDTNTGPQAQAVVLHVQKLLRQAGFKRVRNTGELDAATLSAIRQFEFRYRLPPKGRISYVLVRQLESRVRTMSPSRQAAGYAG